MRKLKVYPLNPSFPIKIWGFQVVHYTDFVYVNSVPLRDIWSTPLAHERVAAPLKTKYPYAVRHVIADILEKEIVHNGRGLPGRSF